ncbi:uncharacterized protein LOC122282312 [Carya illinoinensis]|uniref:uncharacterized protein LOC122282312 n=1 Tax=Carya illinoinensis TaxID=32201 RepID=UPI001C727E56|nr:uncharacterized protein LOC122282312 [Carya illinoinensis]
MVQLAPLLCTQILRKFKFPSHNFYLLFFFLFFLSRSLGLLQPVAVLQQQPQISPAVVVVPVLSKVPLHHRDLSVEGRGISIRAQMIFRKTMLNDCITILKNYWINVKDYP